MRQGIGIDGALVQFAITVAASAALGVAAGVVVSRLVAGVDDHLIVMMFSVVLAYGTYLAAETLHISGIIATVTAGITLGNYGRQRGISEESLMALDTVWEFVAFMLNALVFLLVGFAISVEGLVGAAAPIVWGVLGILAARAILVYGGAGIVSRLARRPRPSGLPLPWLHVTFWAGLRGAIAVALALSLPADVPNRELLQGTTFGIVLFTLLAQGTTAELFLERANVRDLDASEANERR
jgi:monovalent cation:H+ antiporter, CPA1 family